MNFSPVITYSKIYYTRVLTRLTRLYRTVFYAGDAVYCDICNWSGRQFFNQKCPKCNSVSRTRLVPFSLRYFDLIKTHLNILHIAPSINEYTYVKHNFDSLTQYVSLDIKQRIHTNLVQNITDTNLVSETYDLAIVWHVLEYIREDVKAITEVYRLLKPGGHFLVSVPIYPIGNEKTYEDSMIKYKDYEHVHGHYDHCRSCGLDYYERFETVGFTTQELKVAALDEATIAYYGLRTDYVVWCFTKPKDAV